MADAWEAYFALPHWGFNKEGVDMALTDEASGLAVLLAWPGHRQAPVAAGGARRGGGGVEWDREARPLRRRLM